MSHKNPGTLDERATDEPVPTADEAEDAGSSHAWPNLPADLARALACGLLVGGCVLSPPSLPLLTPFIPVIVAMRWIRSRRDLTRFLALATAASLLAALAAASELPGSMVWGLGFAAALALILVPMLGAVHERVARPDAVTAATSDAWPEPNLRRGFSPALAAWVAVTIVVAGLGSQLVDSPRDAAPRLMKEVYDRQEESLCDAGADEKSDVCVGSPGTELEFAL